MSKVRGIHTMSILVASLFLFMAIIPLSDASNMLWFLGIILIIEMIMVTLIISYVMRIEYSAEDLYDMMDEGNDDNVDKVVPNVVPNIVRSVVHTPVVNDNEINSVKATEPISPLIDRIDAAMVNEKLYLQPDLSLVTLCEKIGTNRTYASKAIKDAKGCNFSDYVNRFRLDYALDVMKSLPKDKIIIQNIVVQCGCGSIQTFYRYFKLFFNETPTQWIENNKK
jgi:YesN/AraC family two-component response regulator